LDLAVLSLARDHLFDSILVFLFSLSPALCVAHGPANLAELEGTKMSRPISNLRRMPGRRVVEAFTFGFWWCRRCESRSEPTAATVGDVWQVCERCGAGGSLEWKPAVFPDLTRPG
jgi:ribosomal protein L40E